MGFIKYIYYKQQLSDMNYQPAAVWSRSGQGVTTDVAAL